MSAQRDVVQADDTALPNQGQDHEAGNVRLRATKPGKRTLDDAYEDDVDMDGDEWASEAGRSGNRGGNAPFQD